MLSDEQLRAFHEDGFVTLPRALDDAQVEAMLRRVWHHLKRNGADPDDPTTWSAEQGYKLRRIRSGDPLPSESGVVRTALDTVFGEGDWVPPKSWGQALVTFPSGAAWDVPHHIWHLDHSYHYPRNAIWGTNLFLFVTDTLPRGGGTLVVKSSPLLVDRFVKSVEGLGAKKMKVLRHQFHARSAWLSDLVRRVEDGVDRVEQFMSRDTEVDGVPARVVELTGKAGDAVLCHPWLIHCGAPNALDRPRLMRACRVYHPRFIALRNRGIDGDRAAAGIETTSDAPENRRQD